MSSFTSTITYTINVPPTRKVTTSTVAVLPKATTAFSVILTVPSDLVPSGGAIVGNPTLIITEPTGSTYSTSSVISPTQSPSSGPSSSPSTTTIPPTSAGASTEATTSSLPSSTTSDSSVHDVHPTSGSSTPSPTPTPKASDSSDTGLKAGVGVLAGLLVLALLAIAFLLFRRRKSSRRAHAAPRAYSDGLDPESSTLTTPHKGAVEKAPGRVGGFAFPTTLDDKAVHAKFSQLDQAIADWVAGTFRSGSPVSAEMVDKDVAAVLAGVSAEWPTLLTGDARRRFMLIRGLVASVLCDAWASGELIGNPDVAKMRNEIPTSSAQQQRARILSNLYQSPEHQSAKETAIARITAFIDHATSAVVTVPHSTSEALGTRSNRLKAVVTTASNLALELGQQRVAFSWEMPPRERNGGWALDAKILEDALQEQSAARLQGRRVVCVVFPVVERLGDDEGSGWGEKTIIRRGKVLV